MKNKKGFSLTELLAVIAILAIIFSLATAGIKQIHANIVGKQADNVKKYIEVGAEKYAKEKNYSNGNYSVIVQTLIDEGYIKSDDDGGKINNPDTKEPLNCYIVDISCENDKCQAKINFNKKSTEENQEICKEIINEKYEICYKDGDKCETIDEQKWFSGNVTLGVKKTDTDELITEGIIWTDNDGGRNEGKEYLIDVGEKGLYNKSVSASISTNSKPITKTIRIDKEKPYIKVSIEKENDKTSNKKVTITASDGNGSGIDKNTYYLGENENCDGTNLYNKNTKKQIINKNGIYYVCIEDKAGNRKFDNFEINTIFSKPSKVFINSSDNKAENEWHDNDFSLNFSITEDIPVKYFYGTNSDELNNNSNHVDISASTYNTTYYVKACLDTGDDLCKNVSTCTSNNLCSDLESYTVNEDKIDPSVNVSKNTTSYAKSITITANFTDNESGLKGYKITTSSTTPTSWNDLSGKSDSKSKEVTENGTYYIHVIDKAGRTNKTSIYINTVDNEGPTMNVESFVENAWEFTCGSKTFHFTWTSDGFYVSDLVGFKEYYYKVTTTTTKPTSGWKSPSYEYSGLSCKTRYYLWFKLVDKLGNESYYNVLNFKCNCGSSSSSSSDDSDDEIKNYNVSTICTKKSSCIAANYLGGGECSSSPGAGDCASNEYLCYCCPSETTWSPSDFWCKGK